MTLLHFDGCPNWQTMADRLDILADELGLEVTGRAVTTPVEAEAVGFLGSPSLLVDGRDPFADSSTYPLSPIGFCSSAADSCPSSSPTALPVSAAIQSLSTGEDEARTQYGDDLDVRYRIDPPVPCCEQPGWVWSGGQ